MQAYRHLNMKVVLMGVAIADQSGLAVRRAAENGTLSGTQGWVWRKLVLGLDSLQPLVTNFMLGKLELGDVGGSPIHIALLYQGKVVETGWHRCVVS